MRGLGVLDSQLHAHVVAVRSSEIEALANSQQARHRAELAARKRNGSDGRRLLPAAMLAVRRAVRHFGRARPLDAPLRG